MADGMQAPPRRYLGAQHTFREIPDEPIDPPLEYMEGWGLAGEIMRKMYVAAYGTKRPELRGRRNAND